MVYPQIKQQIEERLDQLPYDMQKRVLDFADALVASEPKGTRGIDLLHFSGTISPDDAEQMLAAVEEACEKIDENEW